MADEQAMDHEGEGESAHMERDMNQATAECINACLECQAVCTSMVPHAVAMGGEDAVGMTALLLDCAQACHLAADFLLRGSEFHPLTCDLASELCRHCADACDRAAGGATPDESMRDCAEVCRHCAEACGRMVHGA